MARDKTIEVGAAAIADDLRLPGGRQKKLAKVVKSHLGWFDAAEARGMTWDNIAQLLSAAGANSEDGKPFTVGTLSSTVWRKRQVGHKPDIARTAVETQARHGRHTGHDRAPTERSFGRAVVEKPLKPRAHRKRSGDSAPQFKKEPPKSEFGSSSKVDSSSKGETLSFMKRAAAIRRATTDSD